MGEKDLKTNILKLMTELNFFKSFDESVVEELAAFASVASYREGDVILQQGDKNDNLYLLLSGRLLVYVDDGYVATINRRGDLVGEMSVISEEVVGATIMAELHSQLLVIPAVEINRLANDLGTHYALYRMFSLNLTEKLRQTNEKAKHFEQLSVGLKKAQAQLEIANMELEKKVRQRTEALQNRSEELERANQVLEQSNAELLASHQKIQELYSNREVTFEKLTSLYKDHLHPLHEQLCKLDIKSGSKEKVHIEQVTIEQVATELAGSMRLLRPMTELFHAEQMMKTKKVVLAEPNRKQQVIAKMALGGTGVNLAITDSAEGLFEIFARQPSDILLVSSDLLAATVEIKAKYPETEIVLLTSEAIPTYLPDLIKHPFIPHIVSRDENDRIFTNKNIMTTVAKLAGSDLFGLEKYLSWGVDVQHRPVDDSQKRGELIGEMDQYFANLGIRGGVRDRCRAVVEELLMNAIYDAPRDAKGKERYNHLPRNRRVILQPEEQGVFRYATDGMLVAIAVEDPFGALSGQTILNYLDSCYGGRAGELNEGHKGGAGRGLHQIIEGSDLVVFNVKEGQMTEVVALIHVDPKQAGLRNRSFHYFHHES